MFRRWTPTRFLGRAESGRNRPLRLHCEAPFGEQRETADFYVKAIGLESGITETTIFCEIAGAAVARSLDVHVADPGLIDISTEFADLVNETAGTSIKPGLASGSKSLGKSISPPHAGRLNPEQLQQAARLYVFDALSQNPDRRSSNYNCAIVDEKIVAFDFEEAFSFLFLPIIGGTGEPWSVLPKVMHDHIFRGMLADQHDIDWEDTFDRLRQLDTAVLVVLGEEVPDWKERINKVRRHIEEVQGEIMKFQWEVLRSLS